MLQIIFLLMGIFTSNMVSGSFHGIKAYMFYCISQYVRVLIFYIILYINLIIFMQKIMCLEGFRSTVISLYEKQQYQSLIFGTFYVFFHTSLLNR
jgi:hypothetical protein